MPNSKDDVFYCEIGCMASSSDRAQLKKRKKK